MVCGMRMQMGRRHYFQIAQKLADSKQHPAESTIVKRTTTVSNEHTNEPSG